MRRRLAGVEWPTLACWWHATRSGGGALGLPRLSLWLAVPVAAWAIAQHASLTHEAIHGHPFRDPRLNALLVPPPLALVIPYLRFRDSHLAHHRDAILTDPYDDPESNYLAERVWRRLPRPAAGRARGSTTRSPGGSWSGRSSGRSAWMASDWRLMRAGDRRVIRGWLLHLPRCRGARGRRARADAGLGLPARPPTSACRSCKIRTFLEHQAHERARGRTVIIEDRGPLALLFLNNNLHVVHHVHPRVHGTGCRGSTGQPGALSRHERRLPLRLLRRGVPALPVAGQGPGAAPAPAAARRGLSPRRPRPAEAVHPLGPLEADDGALERAAAATATAPRRGP